MICWKTVGNRSEAAQAYRRCRQQLDALLGIPPSAETERVYQSVRVPG
jgi:DNA-binding SARP family transcriptional activator